MSVRDGPAPSETTERPESWPLARRVPILLGGLAALVLAQTIAWSPAAPLAFTVGTAAVALLAWWRPAATLVLVAVLMPFGRMYTVVWVDAFPVRGAEMVALAFLAGVALGAVLRPDGLGPRLPARRTTPWLLLATLIVASAAIVARVFQVYQDFPGTYVLRLLTHLATDYHGLPGDTRPWSSTAGFGYLNTAALAVEGLALMLVTARLTAARPGVGRRLAVATVIAGCGAAALSLHALWAAALATGRPIEAVWPLLADGRWAVHVTKVNSAGSYFALVGPLAIGLAVADARRRLLWILAAATIGAGLLLTGSLAAILPAMIAAAAAGSIWLIRRRPAVATRRRAVVALVLLACAVPLTLSALRVSHRPNALRNLYDRFQLSEASLRTAAENPMFGVGIDQYARESSRFISDEVRARFAAGPIQPHNYALHLLAELGPVAPVLFVWGLVVLVAGWRSPPGPADPVAGAPAAAGVGLFLASTLAGQPLLLDTVALPFWIVMGVWMGGPTTSTSPARPSRLLAWAVVAILATIPFRMARETRAIDLTTVVYGAVEQADPHRPRVRVVERRTRFFVPADARAVAIDAYVDGAVGDVLLALDMPPDEATVPIEAGDWHARCVDLAPGSRRGRFRAVDVTPTTASGARPVGPVLIAALDGLTEPCGGADRNQAPAPDVY